MSKPTILLCPPIWHARAEWEALGAKAILKETLAKSKDEFVKELRSGIYDDVVVIYRGNTSAYLYTGDMDAEVVAALPKSVKFVCHFGAGYDSLNAKALNKRGIAISHTPRVQDHAVADQAILLMLGSLRSVYISLKAIHEEGRWERPMGIDTQGKTLGVLGMGGIGQAIADRARAFGMKIVYYNRSRLPPVAEKDSEYVSFDELLARSDVLNLSLGLNKQTKRIIGAPEFAKMKDGVVIVNTARGPLIDEKALVAALDSKKVASAGLDVFEAEPDIEPGLLKHPQCMYLPHSGTRTLETEKATEVLVLTNIESALDSGTLITPITEFHAEASNVNHATASKISLGFMA